MTDRIAEGRGLADRVEELVRDGRPEAARRVFAQNWRDSVPDLPERFSVSLRKINRDLLGVIARRLVGRSLPPELEFHSVDLEIAVRSVDDDHQVIGWLRPVDARFLNDLGEDASLYRPQLLEIGVDKSGSPSSVAISVVRPELRSCSSCGARHADAHVNCAKCRALRRRKGPESESYEPAPVPFFEAVEAMTAPDDDPPEH
jgi:hypothetical protein